MLITNMEKNMVFAAIVRTTNSQNTFSQHIIVIPKQLTYLTNWNSTTEIRLLTFEAL